MRTTWTLPVACLFVSTLLTAQGLHVPHDRRIHTGPSLRQLALTIRAEIEDGAASSEVRQTVRNDGSTDAEATWILPLPAGAAVDRFTMTMNGKDVPGEVLDATQARQVYEDIVRRRRDPGLLEYFGTGALRARIFPLPPQSESAIVVRYRQILPQSGGLVEWSYPLRSAGSAGNPAEKLSLDLTIRSKSALKNVFASLGTCDVLRKGDHEARVSFEMQRGQLPERDLQVFYGLSDQAFGLHLLAHRRAGEAGHFVMLLAPKQNWDERKATARAITFVLDTSGSMQGKKIEQARDALRFFLRSLKPQDWFNVVPFATEAQPFYPELQPARAEQIEGALSRVKDIEARGGTNIEDALRVAFASRLPVGDGAAPLPIVVFLTDGLPTVGTTDIAELLARTRTANAAKARVFVFGVGHDVNTRLLDTLAEESRGDRDYVREHENLEVKTGALFTKVSHPVLTDLQLRCEGIELFDQAPKALPDLFAGGRLMLLGRYRGEGHKAIRLTGVCDGSKTEYVFEASFPANDTRCEFVPTLWAQARVAALLDLIRLSGQQAELVDEVKRLGREYRIVTPYTSHLILEDNMRVAQDVRAWRGPGDRMPTRDSLEELRRAGAVPTGSDDYFLGAARRADEEAKDGRTKLARLAEGDSGAAAVEKSLELKALAPQAGSTPSGPATLGPATGALGGGGAASVRAVSHKIGARTFQLVDGRWVDGRFAAAMKDKVTKVQVFSDEYFALLKARPELAPIFAFSTRVLVVVEDQVIELVDG